MKFKIAVQKSKFEGLSPIYMPFFDSVTKLGSTTSDTTIVFPDTVTEEDISNMLKPYRDYVLLIKDDEK